MRNLLVIAFSLVLAAVATAVPLAARATQTNIISDYSGYILTTMTCTCSSAVYIVAYDYNTMSVTTYSLMPGLSATKLDYMFMVPGVDILGQSMVDTGICLMYAGVSCTTVTADGFITPHPYQGMGTSGM